MSRKNQSQILHILCDNIPDDAKGVSFLGNNYIWKTHDDNEIIGIERAIKELDLLKNMSRKDIGMISEFLGKDFSNIKKQPKKRNRTSNEKQNHKTKKRKIIDKEAEDDEDEEEEEEENNNNWVSQISEFDEMFSSLINVDNEVSNNKIVIGDVQAEENKQILKSKHNKTKSSSRRCKKRDFKPAFLKACPPYIKYRLLQQDKKRADKNTSLDSHELFMENMFMGSGNKHF